METLAPYAIVPPRSTSSSASQRIMKPTPRRVGGVAIFGGSGSVLGATLGALLLATIYSALVVVNVSSFWSAAISGGLLIAAIAFDRLIALRVAPALRTRRRARG